MLFLTGSLWALTGCESKNQGICTLDVMIKNEEETYTKAHRPYNAERSLRFLPAQPAPLPCKHIRLHVHFHSTSLLCHTGRRRNCRWYFWATVFMAIWTAPVESRALSVFIASANPLVWIGTLGSVTCRQGWNPGQRNAPWQSEVLLTVMIWQSWYIYIMGICWLRNCSVLHAVGSPENGYSVS